MDYKEQFQKICEKANLVGANSVIVKNDEIKERCFYGYSDLETKTKTNEKTIYRIASISKTILSIALMQLYEQNRFSLDQDISDIFGFKIRNPKYPDVIITPKMILTQTSSITDGYDDENPDYDGIIKGYNGINGSNIEVSLKELLTNPNNQYYTPLTFSDYAPGERFIYSNFGCGIMACMIEKLSGEYYFDYMEKHIFNPLNIDASFIASRIKRKENIASTYLFVEESKENIISRSRGSFINGSYKIWPLGDNFRGPAGGLFIDMDDLSTLMRMFINGGTINNVRLLKKETIDLMYQIHWIGKGDGYFGKGLQMRILETFEEENKVFRGHTGGAYGVRSYMFFSLKYNYGMIFITNGGGYKTDNDHKILDVFYKTMRASLDLYLNEEKPSVLTIDLEKQIARVDNRTIILDIKPFVYNNDIYLSSLNIIDGLGLVGDRIETEGTTTIKKNGKSVSYLNPIKFDEFEVIPLFNTLDSLGIKYIKKGNIITINY